jgi:DNA-binding transcriptional ArsR family regulator
VYLYIFMTQPDIFRALADPTRRAVFERLSAAELTVGDLTRSFSVSQPAISQHLAVLKGAGMVAERRQGRQAWYRAAPGALAGLEAWVARYRSFWPERVEALKDVLKEMDE